MYGIRASTKHLAVNIKMKLLLIIFLIGLSSQKCPKKSNCSNYVTIKDFIHAKIAGFWYTKFRYENGPEATTCEYTEFSVITENILNLTFKYYWPAPKEPTYATPSTVVFPSTEGKFYIPKWIGVPTIYILYNDYVNFGVYMACINDVDYLWIDTRAQHPSRMVMEKIRQVGMELKLNFARMTELCNVNIEIKI